MLAKKKVIYEPIDLIFLNKNFGKMGLFALLDAFNEIRPYGEKVSLSAMRHQLRRMGLHNTYYIHWSKPDIAFLKKNYRKIGDSELAELLTARKKTSRIIDGKKVIRTFTKKHIEKKRKLMGFIRTPEEVLAIKRRNIASGRQKCLTSTDNLWTRGIKKALKEEEISVNKRGVWIKINGKLTPYPRWFYRNFIEPIPDKYVVYHKDGDIFNVEPDNLGCIPRGENTRIDYKVEALRLLQIRLSGCKKKISENDIIIKRTLCRKQYDKAMSKNKQLMTDVARIEKLILKFTNRRKNYENKKNKGS